MRRRLRYFSQIDRLPPVFGLAFWRNACLEKARGTDLNSSSRDIQLNLSEKCRHPNNTSFFRVFVVFYTKSLGKQIQAKTIGLKNVFKNPPWIWSKKYFLEISQKIPNSRGEKMDDCGRIIEFLPNLKDFPVSRDVELGVGKSP